MLLEQSFTLPFAAATVWPTFADVPMLVACMPGAALSGEPRMTAEGTDIDLVFTVKLGPITGAFQGQGTVQRDDAAMRGTFSGNGADRKSGSRVKGAAKFSLIEGVPGQTRVDVAVDYSLTGSLAQFSRGAIVKELAAALTRDFAENLRTRIAASQHAVANGAPTPNTASAQTSASGALDQPFSPPVSTAEQKAAPLNAGRLFWRIVWARIAGWFGGTSR